MEEWRDIKDYEGLYKVSSYGRVYSYYTKKSLRPRKDKEGYLMVSLYKENKAKEHKVHRLVALHFIPNPNNHPQVNHKDENKANNKVDNLEWCTNLYNHNYGTINTRISKSLKGKFEGSKNGRARKVCCISTGEVFDCIKEASEYYNISVPSIIHCCSGRCKSAGKNPVTGEKLVWKYLE